MNELTKQQLDTINENINSLMWDKAIKVEILGEDHYIGYVQETGAVFLDGSNFEGSLEEMEYMDYSPDDSVDFDELTPDMFQKLVDDINDEKSVVPIIIMLERVSLDEQCFDEQEWDRIIEISEKKDLKGEKDYLFDQTLEKSLLTGIVTEKDDIEESDKYIALLEWNKEKDRFVIIQFHPTVAAEIEAFNQEKKCKIENCK